MDIYEGVELASPSTRLSSIRKRERAATFDRHLVRAEWPFILPPAPGGGGGPDSYSPGLKRFRGAEV